MLRGGFIRLVPFLAAASVALGSYGADALLYACGQLGMACDEEAVARALPEEASLLDLKSAAEGQGLLAVEMKTAAAEVVDSPKPVIACVDGGRFVVVTGAAGGFVDLYDPGAGPTRWKAAEFEKRFTGAALLLSIGQVAGPRAVLEPPEYDFGAVARGEEVSAEFRVRNVGTETLRILRLTSGCGCTATNLERDVLEPGEASLVGVRVDTVGKRGATSVDVVVHSNDPGGPRRFLVRGFVRTEFEWTPRMLNIGLVDPGTEGEARVVFAGSGEADLRLLEAQTSAEWISVSLEERGEQNTWVLAVHYQAPDAPGSYDETILVRTSAKGVPEVRIPFTLRVRSDLEVRPAGVFFGTLSAHDGPKTGQVEVTARNNVRVTGVEARQEGLSATLQEAGPGRWRVAVTFDPACFKGATQARLIIKTDSPREPEVKVPVFAYVR